MTAVSDATSGLADVYQARVAANGAPAWLDDMRHAGFAQFQQLGWPTRRNEEWRFTNIAAIRDSVFVPSAATVAQSTADALTEQFKLDFPAHMMTFVDGQRQGPASIDIGDGVVVADLAAAVANQEALRRYLGRTTTGSENAFTALNEAMLGEGVFVQVPDGADVELPLHISYLNSGTTEGVTCHPRHVIVMGRNSRVTIVESYGGSGDAAYLTNPVTECILADGAHVDHYKIQRESSHGFHVAAMNVVQEGPSHFASHNIDLGGRLVRNDTAVQLNASGSEATLNGFYLARGDQFVDNHTCVDHTTPHCNSFEVYKGILADRGSAVFNGKIFVRQDAQKTNAEQTNRALLLSDDAVLNTKPQLEIFADDVKCTHGATIGQLDENALFYLRTRGISKEAARGLLTYAFAGEAMDSIKVPAIRTELDRILLGLFQTSEQS